MAMRRRNKPCLMVKICISAAVMLLVTAFSTRTVRAANETATPEALETPGTPSPSPEVEVIELIVVTPTPAASAVPTDTPAPVPTAEPASTPEPTPTPTPPPDETALLEAVNGLSEYRRPNRIRRGEIDAILETLPDDLDLSRALIVVKAYSLLGKVEYQFGGKSSEIGWDAVWNTVSSTAVSPDGAVTVKKYGLDCSGYVRWCFINAAGTSHMGKRLGSGTYKQWINSEEIPLMEALPGDLVFTNDVGRTNHDGIVVQNDGGGTVMVLHCTAGKGVVLESVADGGFKYARRPNILCGKNLPTFEASALRHRNETFMADLRYLLAIKDWRETEYDT